jgi:hypothetical protein
VEPENPLSEKEKESLSDPLLDQEEKLKELRKQKSEI